MSQDVKLSHAHACTLTPLASPPRRSSSVIPASAVPHLQLRQFGHALRSLHERPPRRMRNAHLPRERFWCRMCPISTANCRGWCSRYPFGAPPTLVRPNGTDERIVPLVVPTCIICTVYIVFIPHVTVLSAMSTEMWLGTYGHRATTTDAGAVRTVD